MQTVSLLSIHQALHPGKNKRSFTERILASLGNSNYGLHQGTTIYTSGVDSFHLSENISNLLSPACGMTEEEKTTYLNHILAKLKTGQKLTAEEMRFLQAEDPVLYQQAARVQAMRDSLETQLKHCSSKQEAAEVFSSAMSSVSDKDPMKEYIVAAYQNVMDEFKKSSEYQAMPQKDEDTNPAITLRKFFPRFPATH